MLYLQLGLRGCAGGKSCGVSKMEMEHVSLCCRFFFLFFRFYVFMYCLGTGTICSNKQTIFVNEHLACLRSLSHCGGGN